LLYVAEGRCTLNKGAAKSFDEVCTWPERGQLFLQTLGAAPKKAAPKKASERREL